MLAAMGHILPTPAAAVNLAKLAAAEVVVQPARVACERACWPVRRLALRTACSSGVLSLPLLHVVCSADRLQEYDWYKRQNQALFDQLMALKQNEITIMEDAIKMAERDEHCACSSVTTMSAALGVA